MNAILLVLAVSLGIVSSIPAVSAAASVGGDHMNYQGYLTDTGGTPLDGSYPIEFRVYDALTGGTELWTEGHTITVTGGIFTALLGDTTPIGSLFAAGSARYLELEVDGSTLAPRVELAAVSYSFTSATALEAVTSAAIDGNDLAALDTRFVNAAEVGSITGGMIANGAVTMNKLNQSGATVGQVIKWDGAAWLPQADAAGAADSDWVITGDNMYSGVAGNVGIGTTTPAAKLNVVGQCYLSNGSGAHTIILANNVDNDHGEVRVFNAAMANPAVNVDAKDTGDGGAIKMRNSEDEITVKLQAAQTVGSGGLITLTNGAGEETAAIDGEAGTIRVRRANGGFSAELDGDESGGARLILYNGNLVSEPTVDIDAEGSIGTGGEVTLRNNDGEVTVLVDGEAGSGGGGEITLYDSAGAAAITLSSYAGILGGSLVSADIFQVNGADVSEQFEVAGEGDEVRPGMVVSIDPSSPGHLALSDRAYDTRVAGVVSGAGGIRPGMLMGQSGTLADGDHPIAMSGRVYCLADAEFGAIAVGDLLTTSDTPGHARKVTEFGRAQGATIGKAMTSLEQGQGLVLLLVSLQ